MPRTEKGLYDALEEELKKSEHPLSCAQLFDKSSIRKHAATVNRVSDYLGNMWRRGELVRLPAGQSGDSRARWLYAWKGRPKTSLPTMEDAIDFLEKQTILQRPSLEISESGKTIKIELPNLVITIASR
jgi:hypothetical protein